LRLARRVTLSLRAGAVLVLAGALAALAGSAVASRSDLPSTRTGIRPLQTGLVDAAEFDGPTARAGLTRARSAGTTYVRLSLDWRAIAPATRPPRFNPRNPSDPAYTWGGADAQLRNIVDLGLEPLVTLTGAPAWGRRANGLADPQKFAQFAAAAARRYRGSADLPHVRYWQIWNEPNHANRADLKDDVASWYRALVNDAAAALHGVDRRNEVIAGGCSPFTTTTSVGPLFFMRQLFAAPVHFDIWSHHPYTSGGPTHHANGNDDVSLGDLTEMGSRLRREIADLKAVSERNIRFWVTEFAWDTSPPDPKGVPVALQSRWTAEALYRMWAAGVSTVVWWKIRDEPLRTSFYQSGLYFRSWKPKRTLYAFRFPFVAFAEGGRVFAWGRTPAGRPGRVVVEQSSSSGWRRLGTLRTDRYGIFSQLYAPLRARLLDRNDTSLPFSLQVPPDQFFYPFGS
jgi:hypothetical protein